MTISDATRVNKCLFSLISIEAFIFIFIFFMYAQKLFHIYIVLLNAISTF